MFFKRKSKCFHEWKLRDYTSYTDSFYHSIESYELTCIKCDKSRWVAETDYNKLKELKLLK